MANKKKTLIEIEWEGSLIQITSNLGSISDHLLIFNKRDRESNREAVMIS